VRLYIPNGDSHIPQGVPDVVMTKGTKLMWDALDVGMATQQPVAFIGPKGVAKTLAVQKWCEDKGMPMLVYDCSEETEPHHFEGQWAESDEGIMFVGGVMIQAYSLANKFGYCVVVLEELNALTGFTQKRLNSTLDWRKNWYVPQLSRTFQLKEGAKILFVACMNPTSHGGVHELNEDFKSRWSAYNIQYPSKVEEQAILEGVLTDVPEMASWFHKFITLADETRQGDKSGLSYALSPRDVVRLIRNFAYAIKLKSQSRALEMCKREFAACFPEDERVTAKLRFAAIMGGSVADDDDEE
jgi:MoxR-like ATPase